MRGIRTRARRSLRRLGLAILAVGLTVFLTGCAAQSGWNYSDSEFHVVRKGETLAVIAKRYGKDHRDLARWNGLGDGSLIHPGQKISLSPPSASAAAAQQSSRPSSQAKNASPGSSTEPSPVWSWPTNGRLVAGFDGKPGAGTGLLIGGKAGQPVRAAATGRVVYSGSGLIGYGQLIILKHNDTYLSAYGHNESVLVREGEQIKKGQRIATMGEGPGLEPRLHFEIRRNGKPVDPRQYLPAR